MPTDLIVVPEVDVSQGHRVYLIDVVGMPLPRRLVLFADDTSTVRRVRTIARMTGAQLICELPTTLCTMRSAAPDNRQVW